MNAKNYAAKVFGELKSSDQDVRTSARYKIDALKKGKERGSPKCQAVCRELVAMTRDNGPEVGIDVLGVSFKNIKKNLVKAAKYSHPVGWGILTYEALKSRDKKKRRAAQAKLALVKKRADAGDPKAKKAIATVKAQAKIESQQRALTAKGMSPETPSVPHEVKPPKRVESREPEEMPEDLENGPDETDESEDSEDSDEIGFDFGKALKVTAKIAAPIALQVAKTTPAGQAVSAALAMAPPEVKKGLSVLKAVNEGDPAAIAKVAKIQELAKAGSPDAKAALDALKEAKGVRDEAIDKLKAAAPQSAPSGGATGELRATNQFVFIVDPALARSLQTQFYADKKPFSIFGN